VIFELSEEQIKQVKDWDNPKTGHKCKLKPNDFSDKYCGAVGGHLNYTFIPTGIGVFIEVKCVCGEKLDISEI
jgi:hypothetical protein